jgi:hypothetical protein
MVSHDRDLLNAIPAPCTSTLNLSLVGSTYTAGATALGTVSAAVQQIVAADGNDMTGNQVASFTVAKGATDIRFRHTGGVAQSDLSLLGSGAPTGTGAIYFDFGTPYISGTKGVVSHVFAVISGVDNASCTLTVTARDATYTNSTAQPITPSFQLMADASGNAIALSQDIANGNMVNGSSGDPMELGYQWSNCNPVPSSAMVQVEVMNIN